MMTKQTKPAKKRINSKRKGNRAEWELAKILTERFNMPFARVGVASGARVKNTRLPDNAIEVMTGDLIPPPGFRFSIESKSEKVDIDLLAPSVQFDKWLKQATCDADSISKIPMLCWKRHRKGWIVAIPSKTLKNGVLPLHYTSYGFGVLHRGWIVCRLDALLEANDDRHFWFDDGREKLEEQREYDAHIDRQIKAMKEWSLA